MADFTLNDLVDFTENERKMVDQVLPVIPREPDANVVNTILAYSAALSTRPSELLGTIRTNLN
jgi:hypothetical protein